MSEIETTLKERTKEYGDFVQIGIIVQSLKRSLHDSPNWSTMPDYQKEALEMIAHKMGRILNGNCNHLDSWHDIVGYAKLVENVLRFPLTNNTQIVAEQACDHNISENFQHTIDQK